MSSLSPKESVFPVCMMKGLILIVSRVEIDYKYPLRSRDRFVVRLNIEREGNVRLLFIQEICRMPDEKLIASARVTGVATKNGKPVSPANIAEQLGLKQI